MRFLLRVFSSLLIMLLLVGCTPPLTQVAAQATAFVAGCWPGNVATPRAVTVTPDPRLITPTLATATAVPGLPTSTPWPTATRAATTTPYPRCTPGPHDTLVPYPTAVPPRPRYPTQLPVLRQGGSDEQNTIQLPGHTFHISLAVHPTEGWPVVGMMQRFSESSDPIQSFVRVFNPHAHTWGSAQQVDVGSSSNGMDRNGSTVVGVTGDGVVHAVWGGSDQVVDGQAGGLWTSASGDYGMHWSAPRRIATNCIVALDMATTAEGAIVVLANCYTLAGDDATFHAGLIVRHPDGTWELPAHLSAPATFGAVVITGQGAETTAHALTTAVASQGDPRQLYDFTRRLFETQSWTIQTQRFAVAGIDSRDLGDFGFNLRGMTFMRSRPNGPIQSGIVFVFSGWGRAGAYALTSLDDGRSWGAVEAIVVYPGDSQTTGTYLTTVTPAYDPAADRLIAIWACCDRDAGTHYASWSAPGSGVWQPAVPSTPLALGSHAASVTVSAQAANSRTTWVAWVDSGNQVHSRTVNLNQIIPVADYPTPSPPPSPTVIGDTP